MFRENKKPAGTSKKGKRIKQIKASDLLAVAIELKGRKSLEEEAKIKYNNSPQVGVREAHAGDTGNKTESQSRLELDSWHEVEGSVEFFQCTVPFERTLETWL